MEKARLTQETTRHARDDRARTLASIQGLEHALASASFAREGVWRTRVAETLAKLQLDLRESRHSANAQGSLLHELAIQFPHLENRVQHIRKEYDALQKQIDQLRDEMEGKPVVTPEDAERVRRQLANLLVNVRRIQAKETELIFEGYHVDIGVGD